MIPLLRPPINKDDIKAVTDQLKSGMLVGGGKVAEFEKEFAEYVGCKYAIAVNGLTNGYCVVLDMLKPTEINLPSATYISMANMPKKLGVNITFRDEWIAGKAYIIPTDKGLIIDSAHEIDRDICKGNPDAIWLFSFHATKLLSTGKGGMICTNSKPQADFMRSIADNGRLYGNYKFDYVVHNAGWNFYMSDLTAALGLSQLRRLDETNKKRDKVKEMYDKHLVSDPRDNWSRYIYQVWIDDFPIFFRQTKLAGIQVSKHFNPIHKQPLYFTNQKLPVTEEYAEHLISIPFYADMTGEEVYLVSKFINNWRMIK